MMKKRALGDTGLWVSPIGLGTVKFGRNTHVKYPDNFALPSMAELANLMAMAKDCGINLVDTAPSYGLSEERLGQLLQGQRNDWVVVGKAGEVYDGAQSHYDFAPASILASVEQSLKTLKTDYMDVLLLHANNTDDVVMQNDELIDCLLAIKQSGKARAVGLSNFTVAGGLLALDVWDAVMVSYNPTWLEQLPVIEKANQLNKGVLIKRGLNSGHVGQLPGDNPVRDALRFCLDTAGVHSVMCGTINPLHIQQNADYAA